MAFRSGLRSRRSLVRRQQCFVYGLHLVVNKTIYRKAATAFHVVRFLEVNSESADREKRAGKTRY